MIQITDQIDQLFEQVLQHEAKNRRYWLQQHCTDKVILAELLSLLDAHEQAGDFLQQPLQVEAESIIKTDLIGRQLGPYQINALMAYGGMGRIYRAHRSDGEYEQAVAIKLIESASIDPALLRYERQILADLHHPNIVSLLDGGSLEEGVPYLVMELIQGHPIHDYVRQYALSERQIILLFCNLARIINQIHQYGVIHGDLKPDNILVTDEGDLKLLDFGVAYLYSVSAAEQGLHSHAITPGYASPQRYNNPRPKVVDDVYSLGVILGVLLSGQTPKAKYADLSTIKARLKPELKAVFCMATDPEPSLRYNSAGDLSADLYCYLEQKPLEAMGCSYGYLLGKFLRRHWRKIGGVLLVLVLLITVVLVNIKAEQAHSLAVSQVNSVLRDLDNKMERLPGSTLTRVSTVEETLSRLEIVSQQQPNDLKIKQAMAYAHLQLGSLLGHPFQLHLNEFQRGRKHLEQALALYQTLFDVNKDNFPAAMQVVKAERILIAHTIFTDGLPEKGLAALIVGLERLKRLQPKNLREKGQLAIQYLVISHVLAGLGRLDEAAAIYPKVEALLQHPNDSRDKYEREHNERIFNYFLEEKAGFALANQAYVQAKTEFEHMLQRLKGKELWRDRRRSSRAHYGLACIALFEQHSITKAAEHLQQAQALVLALVQQYPAAISLKWELTRYAALDLTLPETREAWISAFHCRSAHRIMDPPMPTKKN